MATTLGISGAIATLPEPAYEREGYVRTAQDVGVMHQMADGSAVYDSITTKYRFRLSWPGVTEAEMNTILTQYLIKSQQIFSPPNSATTYNVLVVKDSWQDTYLEDSGGTAYYWCQMELVEVS